MNMLGDLLKKGVPGLLAPKWSPRRSDPNPLTPPGFTLVNARRNPVALAGYESQSVSSRGGLVGDDFLRL